jgi:hypothetical protein
MTKFVLTLTLLVVVMTASIDSKPWIQGVGKNNISLKKITTNNCTVRNFSIIDDLLTTEANNERPEKCDYALDKSI